MEQRDYLKKQIDMIGLVLGKLLSDLMGMRSTGKLSVGIETTKQSLKTELDIEIDKLIDMPNHEFIHFLQITKNYENENLSKLAEILLLMADNTEDEQRSKKLYEKTLIIFEHLQQTDNVYSFDRKAKIDRIKSLI